MRSGRRPRRAPTPSALLDAAARHRVLLSAGLAAAAVATGLSVVAPTPDPGVAVLAAARDLPAGAPLSGEDLRTVRLPDGAVPDGALLESGQARGRLLAGPVRSGEPLTDVRLLGAALVPPGGDVATPVRVADPAVGHLVAAGDRVDVLAADVDGGPARTVVSDVPVLAVPQVPDDVGEGALVVVAATPGGAARLASAAVTSRLSLVVRGR